jgi:hypothetical protein
MKGNREFSSANTSRAKEETFSYCSRSLAMRDSKSYSCSGARLGQEECTSA